MSDKPLTDDEGEVRELTAADMRRMRTALEVLPEALVAVLPRRGPGQRGPGKRPAKESITLRLDPDIIQRFRATGPGWQGRINDALRRTLEPTG